MAWRRMKLRGGTVFARCDASGQLVADGGRVEIRYKANDGRAYAAAARNLEPVDDAILPDETCGEAERVAKADTKAATKSATKGGKTSTKTSAAPNAPAAGEALAYCDGACSGNPGPCGLGAVLMYGDERRELSEYLGRGTNNIAELTAILRVVEASPDGVPLQVYTDSSYGIGVLQKGWKAKANVELVATIRAALAKHGKTTLHYVKGHAGIPLNERADQLAVAAVEARASAGWVKPRR
ncbi:MAG: ribonuclease HI [Sandaracinus sp.]|nr:ribonuclease HI [Sandaracinus sp.]MCB9624576.1 ribonuclease HI [Sandaracinus sp.]MCB9632590.1 ribonuclease HI [Sandaracinus sp.]